MADLTQTILAGTSQIAGGMRDLTAARERKTARKQAALQAVNEAFGEAAKSFREYKSWEAKKAAENDVKQILDAERLGTITKAGARGGLIGLEAVRPSTVEGYQTLIERKAALTKEAQTAAKMGWDAMQDMVANQRNAAELENVKKRTAIAEAELGLAKNRDTRANIETMRDTFFPKKTPKNIDPLSEEGIAASEERARRLKQIEDEDNKQPVPESIRPFISETYKIPEKYVQTMTKGDLAFLKTRPQEEWKQILPMLIAMRNFEDYEPPELKDAKKKLDELEADLRAQKRWRSRRPAPKGFDKATEDPAEKAAEEARLDAEEAAIQAEIDAQKANVEALRANRPKAPSFPMPGSPEGAQAPAGAPVDLGLTPEGQAEFDAMPPEVQAEIRRRLGK